MVFDDGSGVFGHIRVEHPQYIFFCDYPTCYRSFITRLGLYKHKKQVHPKEQDKPEPDTEEYAVGCVLCGLEFTSEEACNEHDCPSHKKTKEMEIRGQHIVPEGESKLLFCNDNCNLY